MTHLASKQSQWSKIEGTAPTQIVPIITDCSRQGQPTHGKSASDLEIDI